VHGRHQAFEDWVKELAGFFRVPVGKQLHGALQVGEKHRDLLTLAFESALRVEDLLSQMRGRVRAWGTLWFAGWHRYRCRTTDLDQYFAVLVDSQTLGVDEFGLQILKVLVVEFEASFECPIGHAPLALEEVEYMGQDFIKRHAESSTRCRFILCL
jgi:hypothetical protein